MGHDGPVAKKTRAQVPRPVLGLIAAIEVVAVWETQGPLLALSIPVVGLVVGLLIRAFMKRLGRLPSDE